MQDDWKNFKDPMKQAGRNLKDGVRDYIEDHSDGDYDAHKQQSCLEFYSSIIQPPDPYLGISDSPVSFSIKTKRGIQKFTFWAFEFYIDDGCPHESIDIEYHYLQDCPQILPTRPPQKTSGIIMAVLFLILGLLFAKIFLIGTIIGVIRYFTAPSAYDMTLFLKDDDGNTGLCTVPAISGTDCTMIFKAIYQGIQKNIKYIDKYEPDTTEQAAYLAHLGALKTAMEARFRPSSHQA